MATILLTWELGGGLGHLVNLLASWGQPPLQRLSRLFHEVDEHFLVTLPELDHYPQRRNGVAREALTPCPSPVPGEGSDLALTACRSPVTGLMRMLGSGELSEAARRFAAKHPDYDPLRQIAAMADRIEQLLSGAWLPRRTSSTEDRMVRL